MSGNRMILGALVGLMFGSLLGCDDGTDSGSAMEASAAYAQVESPAAPATANAAGPSTQTPDPAKSAAAQQRKIIYTTSVTLVVKDYQDFEVRIAELVDQHGGFVMNAETQRRYSDQQSGTWTVRVPVDRYAAFLTAATSLGFAESRRENAQDVTEEFVDVEARIRNKRELEKRIITMLEERTGKLADVLEIERELSRVREEIEVMEGRLRYLTDRTSLATITINCREQQEEYIPVEAPTFADRIQQSWQQSLDSLTATAQNLAVVFVAMVPWMIVFSLPLIVFAAAFRFSRRRK